MSASFIPPLERSIDHMKRMLFGPFDLGKWFVLGFSAFLANLASGGGGGGINVPSGGSDWPFDGAGDAEAAVFSNSVGGWVTSGIDSWSDVAPWIFVAVGCFALLFLLVLVGLLLWLSSRGQFMFLDNVLHDRAEIRAPWHRFKELGNSLFVFQLVLSVVSLVVILAALIPMFLVLWPAIQAKSDPSIPGVLLSILPVIAVGVALVYVSVFLRHFIVPIMHRHGVKTTDAWGLFMPVLKANLLSFILYGLWLMVLWIVVGIAIIIVGFLTCCIGFLILIIPYIGTVALLPIYVTFRAFGVEFLSQFMPEIGLGQPPEDAAGPEPEGTLPPPPLPEPDAPEGWDGDDPPQVEPGPEDGGEPSPIL